MMKLAVTGTMETKANLEAGAKAVPKAMNDKVTRAGFHMERKLVTNRFSRYGPQSLAVGKKLPGESRGRGISGHARASIRSVVTQKRGVATATVGSNVFYVGVHESGKTITAKTPGKPLRFKARSGRWVSKYTVQLPARGMFKREFGVQRQPLARILGEIPKVVVRVANGSR